MTPTIEPETQAKRPSLTRKLLFRSPRSKSPKSPKESAAQPAMIGQGKLTPYMFSFPAVLVVSAVLAYPVLAGIYQSLFRADEIGLPEEWVGFQNYSDLFNDGDFYALHNQLHYQEILKSTDRNQHYRPKEYLQTVLIRQPKGLGKSGQESKESQ